MWTHRAWPLAPRERLRSYAGWCNAVEGNTTFYATPSRGTAESWAAQTDPDFRMVMKLPKAVTHEHRFAELPGFLSAIEPLGARVHALWLQFPASFGPNDIAALEHLFRLLPGSYRYAVEVRHRAFFDDPRMTGLLETTLSKVDAEWIPFDTTVFFQRPPTSEAERATWTKKPRLPRRSVALTNFPIVRYLGRDDITETVAGWEHWADVVSTWLCEGRSPTVFIHTPDDADALTLARRFHEDVRRLVPQLEPLPEPIPVGPPTLF